LIYSSNDSGMKKVILKSIMFLFFTLAFIKCNRQLDLKPLGQLTEETFFQTEEDFESASLAPYATLLSFYFDQFGNEWYQPMLFPDDDVTVRSNSSDNIEDFNWLPDNGNFRRVWEISYRGVNRANIVIEQLPKAAKFRDEKNKVRYEAEARFMRAYFNFILAVNWGTPPLLANTIKTLEESRISNSKPGEIWDVIVSDLTFAKQNLPASWSTNDIGRATKGAASGMLGRVLLYRAQWENKPALYAAADAEFTTIISSGVYNLRPNFGDNFDVTKENNAESLFEVQFAFGRDNNWFPNEDGGGSGTGRYIMWRTAGEQGQNAPGANADGYGFVHIVKPLQAAFEPGDPRRIETIYLANDPWPTPTSTVRFNPAWSVTGSTPSKYIRRDKSGAEVTGWQPNMGTNNERVLRYADILLMSAECKILGQTIDLAGAAALINQVRRRADPTGAILPNIAASLTKDQMFRALMRERRVELALESHRYNDLVRWHRAGLINIKTDIDFGRTPANNNWTPKNLLKPIPLRDLDLNNNLKQNPDY
jgi:starch-binding outer membrane protein, SusD/RagB family